MERVKTLVLGGGITGLAAGAILNAPVITDDVKIPEGPVYLYDYRSSIEFLNFLGIPTQQPRACFAGYISDGHIYEKPKRKMVSSYGKKTCRPDYMVTSTSFWYRPVDWADVTKACIEKIPQMVFNPAVKIDLDNNSVITEDEVYTYDLLINTIPAPLFYKLAGQTTRLRGVSVKIEKTTIPDDVSYAELVNFDYVYFMDRPDKRLRWTNDIEAMIRGDKECGYLESLVEHPREGNSIRIVSGELPYTKNVLHAGRFAEWNGDRLIHQSIKKFFEDTRRNK